jgi:HrpA-like RNA helicase
VGWPFQNAEKLLVQLKALDENRQITALGRAMAK